MANHDHFFREKKPAAVVKHGVLGHYVKLFTTLLGSKSAQVWVIDAFAGPGEYEGDDETPAEPGSPKILCDVANSVTNTDVHGVYIEPSADFVAQLRALVQANGKPGHHTVLHGEAEQHLKNAVDAAGTSPLLIFLDPFGAAVSMDSLVASFQGRPKWTRTEILLNFNVEAIWRIGGYLTSAHPGLAESNALTIVDNFVGGDWWRKVFIDIRNAGGAPADAASAVADEFNRRLKQRLGLSAFTVPISRRPGQKPIFLLTLYFTNDAAAWAFAESSSSANAKLRGHQKKVADADLPTDTLFSAEMLLDASDAEFEKRERDLETEWATIIAANIERLLETNPEIVLKTAVFDLYGSALGQAREKHIRSAWDALAKKGLAANRDKSIKRLRDAVIRRRSHSSG